MLANGKFQGTINGKHLNDYKKGIDWDIKDENKRLELINEIFNLDEIGSNEEFWQEIWDCGICKVNLNTTDARWEETNIAKFLETVGNYFMYGYNKKEKKRRDNLELFETMSEEDITNDKNYRLAPPNKIDKSDFRLRELFKGTYEDYVEKVKDKGYEIKERETWERIKYNEQEKIRFLTDAQKNLDVLKEQMERLKKEGTLQYNKCATTSFSKMNVKIKLSKQLERYGLSNKDILEIEDKIYREKNRSTGVMLFHLQSNLKDVKDYMIDCKLSYMNRVMIKPPKCPTVHKVLEKIDYLDPTHIRGMLMLGNMKLDPSKDMAVIANDINKKIKSMYSLGQLSDRDMHIIEGIRFNVSQETLGKELGVTADAISKTLNRICDNIAKSFYDDHMDWYFLNVSKGKYKRCSKCGEVKLTNQFDKKGKQGLQSRCKSCRKNS